jgi:hypothetical protein
MSATHKGRIRTLSSLMISKYPTLCPVKISVSSTSFGATALFPRYSFFNPEIRTIQRCLWSDIWCSMDEKGIALIPNLRVIPTCPEEDKSPAYGNVGLLCS